MVLQLLPAGGGRWAIGEKTLVIFTKKDECLPVVNIYNSKYANNCPEKRLFCMLSRKKDKRGKCLDGGGR